MGSGFGFVGVRVERFEHGRDRYGRVGNRRIGGRLRVRQRRQRRRLRFDELGGSTYHLSGKESDLRKLVNHKVQVQGKLESSSSSMGGSSTSGSAGSSTGATGSTTGAAGSTTGSTASGSAGSSGASGSMAGAQHLNVSSVKDIGGSCSAGG